MGKYLKVISFFVICLTPMVLAKGEIDQYSCAVCRLLVEEILYSIDNTDASKTIERESFRVDPRGNQKPVSIKYKRSEAHLTDILGSLCNEMERYAQSTDKKTGEVSFTRTDARDGKAVVLENITVSQKARDKLKRTCENFVEEHDEDVLTFFRTWQIDPKQRFCQEVTNFCKKREEYDGDDEDDEEPVPLHKRLDL